MLARISCALSLLSLGSAAAAPRTFMIDSSASSVRLHVGKTGLVSFAGHEHEVVARSVEGEVDADFEDLSRSAVEVVVDASSLTVRAEGEPEGDPPQIEQAMKGRQVLDAKRFPDIRFRSQQVTAKGLSPGSYQLTVAGDLLLHGAVQPIVVPIRIDLMDDVLTGTGKFVLKQTDFGIEPTTAAAGLVKVEATAVRPRMTRLVHVPDSCRRAINSTAQNRRGTELILARTLQIGGRNRG